jgi:hypothetical protein
LAAVRPVFEPICLIPKLASFFPAKLCLCFSILCLLRLLSFGVLLAFSVAGAISSASFFAQLILLEIFFKSFVQCRRKYLKNSFFLLKILTLKFSNTVERNEFSCITTA